MSELKATTVYDAYWKANSTGEGTGILVYLKSEADKYIKELKEQNHELCQALHSMYSEEEMNYQKYKRCLAMAEWCESTALWCYQAANTLPIGFHATLYGKPVMIEPDRLFNRFVLLNNWGKRWRKLAEKFKEDV